MESKYNYFKRDISWLSFNYRVLLEALDERLPLYERINFISIYSSNLEEFYKIRVADHKAVASGATETGKGGYPAGRRLFWMTVYASMNKKYCLPCAKIISSFIKTTM